MEKKVFNISNFRNNKIENKANNVNNNFSELGSTSVTNVNTMEITLSQPSFAELPDCNDINKITLDLGDLNSGPMRPILKVCNY